MTETPRPVDAETLVASLQAHGVDIAIVPDDVADLDPSDIAEQIDLDAVVDVLRARGIDAYVEQTGGGCATIYAGPTYTVVEAGDECVRRAAVAGPGWFDGPGWTVARGWVGDFYVGPDDDGEAVSTTVETADPAAVATLIAEQIDRHAAEVA